MYFKTIAFIKAFIPVFIISGAFHFAGGCANKKVNERQQVNNVIYKLIEADNNSDIRSVLNAYTDSIEFYPAEREFIKGIKNVQWSYEKLFKENKLSLTTQIIETKILGDNAIVTGLNKGTRKNITDSSVTKIDDKYIAILVRSRNGEWKIDKLMWGINH